MALFLWLPALLLAALIDPAVAVAGPSICNDTGDLHQLAVSSRGAAGWITEGWRPLRPGDCMDPVPPQHRGKFIYFRAQSPGYRFRDDSIRFCTAPGTFRIEGSKDCASRGYAEQRFAKALAGPEAQDIQLSAHSHNETAPDAAGEGVPYKADVVFQGCETPPDGAVACRFVSGGMQIRAEAQSAPGSGTFAFLQKQPHGAPLLIEGEMTTFFGSYGELMLHSAVLRKPNRFDRMLQTMQGDWQLAGDPYDRFTVSGAIRRSSYRGSAMAPEYISVQSSCRGKGFVGDFLMTRDSERGTSLCYQIKDLTPDEMTLIYLPHGTRLVYQRRAEG